MLSIWIVLSVLCLWCIVFQKEASAIIYSKEGEETTEEEESDLFSPIKSSPQHFLRLYGRYEHICKGINNFVPARADGFSNEEPNRLYPWSLNSGTLHHYLNLPFTRSNHNKTHSSPAARVSAPLPICNTPTDIVNMIAEASIHLPPKCRLVWFSPPSICKLFNRYSLIQFNGDSLMRHMTQAFFMIFKENLRFGAFPPNQKSELYDKCGCDGEFSEHELCRSWWLFLQGDKTHTTIDLRPHGLCSYFDAEVYSPNMNRTYFTYEHEVYSFATVLSCNEIRERPAFIFLNAGAHFRTDINRVIGEYLTSMLTQIKAAFNDCMDRVHIVFLGTIVCADHVEKMYPHQARALSNDFNVKISSWLHEHHPNVLFLNPWNITREAVRRTSDGFHGLSDTNMLHATTMLNLMHAFLK